MQAFGVQDELRYQLMVSQPETILLERPWYRDDCSTVYISILIDMQLVNPTRQYTLVTQRDSTIARRR